jgi:hypothetical protein
VGHAACMWMLRNAYTILLGKYEINLKESDHLGDIGIYVMIILK